MVLASLLLSMIHHFLEDKEGILGGFCFNVNAVIVASFSADVIGATSNIAIVDMPVHQRASDDFFKVDTAQENEFQN